MKYKFLFLFIFSPSIAGGESDSLKKAINQLNNTLRNDSLVILQENILQSITLSDQQKKDFNNHVLSLQGDFNTTKNALITEFCSRIFVGTMFLIRTYEICHPDKCLKNKELLSWYDTPWLNIFLGAGSFTLACESWNEWGKTNKQLEKLRRIIEQLEPKEKE